MAVALLVVWASACGDNEVPPDPTTQFGVMLEGGFEGDHVRVVIDGLEVYADTTTTERSTGHADGVAVELSRGTHSITVIVNDAVRTDSTFIRDDLWGIGVNFRRAFPRVDLRYLRDPPFYG